MIIGNMMLIVIAIILKMIFGNGDFKRVKLHGPYQVGFKEFRSQANKNFANVFYPIDKEEYDKKIGSANVSWLRHGEYNLKACAKWT